MKLQAWLFWREHVFALVIGLLDGVLTAVTFAAAKIVVSFEPISLPLALRLATAAALTGGFVFFVAEYARLRGELVHAERHLNLTSHGRLATTQLGQAVFREALEGALLSGACGFVGALVPLLSGAVLPGPRWLAPLVAVLTLGLVGLGLAFAIHGNLARWALVLMIAGTILTTIGVSLHVV
jgi:VIT1/CCC1 family predicted Fe2+/Mn2+ transporter